MQENERKKFVLKMMLRPMRSMKLFLDKLQDSIRYVVLDFNFFDRMAVECNARFTKIQAPSYLY